MFPPMSQEEIKVIIGFAGFWAGILLGFGLFGFPVHASHSVEHASAWPPASVTAELPNITGASLALPIRHQSASIHASTSVHIK